MVSLILDKDFDTGAKKEFFGQPEVCIATYSKPRPVRDTIDGSWYNGVCFTVTDGSVGSECKATIHANELCKRLQTKECRANK